VFTTVADHLESLWIPGYKTFPEEQFVLDGVQVRRFPICYRKWRRRASRVLGLLPNWRWKAQFWRPGFRVPGLDNALRNCGADVFHIGPLPYNNMMYAGLDAGKRRRVPVIATPCVHLGEQSSNAVLRYYLQTHQVELLRHCDRVLCMTDVEREHLQRMGVRKERLETIGLGIDINQATGGSGERVLQRYGIDGPVVLHLGVKAYEKGSVTLIEAMQLVWAQGSPAWLLMAGSSMSEFDQFLAAQATSMPKLVNLPAFADEEKKDLFAAATVVAQPSRVESLGLIMIEAWANGKPVVAADTEVSRQLTAASGAGVVTPFGNSEALARELRRLLSDEALSAEMGRRGQQTAEAFDGRRLWARNAQEFEKVMRGYGNV
jgi:glycosyltransferase involved in cell wall biosynthesis